MSNFSKLSYKEVIQLRNIIEGLPSSTEKKEMLTLVNNRIQNMYKGFVKA